MLSDSDLTRQNEKTALSWVVFLMPSEPYPGGKSTGINVKVRLGLLWYSIGESNGTRNPEHRMKWRFMATSSGGVIKSVIKKSIEGNYYHILDSNDSSDRIRVLELVVRPRFNQIGVGDSPPLFLTGRIA